MGLCAGTPFTRPDEIGDQTFLADKATQTWSAATPAVAGTLYDVVRGSVTELPVGSGAAETCLAPGISVTSAADAATPPPGAGYWYLVRGRNACGIGTWGFRAVDGVPTAERATAACP
jgi:hypothetical protein